MPVAKSKLGLDDTGHSRPMRLYFGSHLCSCLSGGFSRVVDDGKQVGGRQTQLEVGLMVELR